MPKKKKKATFFKKKTKTKIPLTLKGKTSLKILALFSLLAFYLLEWETQVRVEWQVSFLLLFELDEIRRKVAVSWWISVGWCLAARL